MAFGRYKNIAQKRKAEEEQAAILQLKIQNQLKLGDLISDASNRLSYNIPPPPSSYKNPEDELNDKNLQMEKAKEKLTKNAHLFGIKAYIIDSIIALSKLDEIDLFNRFSEGFLKEISTQRHITPDVFEALWDRYKDKLIATGNTGIEIGLNKDDLQSELFALENTILPAIGSISVPAIVGPSTPSISGPSTPIASSTPIVTLPDEINLATDILNFTNNGEYKEIDRLIDEGYKKYKPTKNYRDSKLITLKIRGKNVQYRVFWDSISGKWVAAPKSSGIVKGSSDDVVGSYIMGLYGYDNHMEYLLEPATLAFAVKSIRASAMSGVGLRIRRAPKPQKFKRETILGRGIKNPVNFGNYFVSPRQLSRNTLCIRYPSGPKHQNFNNCVISPIFCKIMNSIIYENKFDEADYDEHEQKKFDDLLTQCRVDGKTAIIGEA